MAQTQTMLIAAFEHERCKPNAACAQKVIPVMGQVATDEDIGLAQVCNPALNIVALKIIWPFLVSKCLYTGLALCALYIGWLYRGLDGTYYSSI